MSAIPKAAEKITANKECKATQHTWNQNCVEEILDNSRYSILFQNNIQYNVLHKKLIDLNTKEDEQYPIAILIQDMDDKKLYGISYINPYNEEEMLPRQKRFRDIAEFEKYYSKMQEKLEIENYKKRKIYPIPRAKKISKKKQYNYLKNIAGNIDKEINKTKYYKKGES